MNELAYPHTPGIKTEHPETSKEAATVMVSRAKTLREEVERQLGGRPMTADECAEAMGESVLSIRPRLSELRKLKRIEDTGDRRPNASGHSAAVWRTSKPLVQSEMRLA